ncbi:MAG: bifunctional (p)ppGpp synthetase/guanosine-3',5'-bis(diphosphate) 3'-pyrophosphohydrolase [Actinomycetia bacterium]|nr:bifunctional (p)ppGpp synthetase/guanosine-3',5'-bis(diphosphate) 3'-pyrophosphohydrolase [Actinomycetes bacterium]MCP4959772.1 bifunctional (p)ppGpp synthetase/guanosine-3',5'-bis(diphosphate) 3'-pyrophosphohydrolase [Actinomycetes bacterium]
MIGDRFDEAFVWAHDRHRDQRRKTSNTPYITHLMVVASLAIDDAANDPALVDMVEEIAIAALLHDVVEDTDTTPDDVAQRFGLVVAEIVEGCSDTDIWPKPPWGERKEAYLLHLRSASSPTLCVALADKRHNATDILADLRSLGPSVWDRFNAGPDQQKWFHEELASVFGERRPGNAADDYSRTVRELVAVIDAQRR